MTTDASIGIALAPQDGTDLDQILKNADLAMYAAKAAGRRTYRFFEPEMDAQVRARRMLEIGSAPGDRRRRLRGLLPALPRACRTTRSPAARRCCAGAIRERGMISPAEFIPIAEETGLINQLGEWVLTTACSGGRELARRHPARGQRLAGAVQERHAGAEGHRGAGRLRPAGEPARARDHRGGADPRRRRGARRSCTSSAPSASGSRSTISAPAIPR